MWVHTMACGWSQHARVGSFYPMGSKGGKPGWQAWWQVPLPTEWYHQSPPHLLTKVFSPLPPHSPPPLPLPPTFPSYYIECSTFCIWVRATLWCLNLNQLCHSLVDTKSWLVSNLFIPWFLGTCFGQEYFCGVPLGSTIFCSTILTLTVVWLLTIFFSLSPEDWTQVCSC